MNEHKIRRVCELEKLGSVTSQSSLSQHLKILKDADLITVKQIGAWAHYTLKNPEIITFLESLKQL